MHCSALCPALVRLALEGCGETCFIDQLVFYLELNGRNNDRYLAFSPPQRRFVVQLLYHFLDIRAEEIEANLDADSLLRAIDVWDNQGLLMENTGAVAGNVI